MPDVPAFTTTPTEDGYALRCDTCPPPLGDLGWWTSQAVAHGLLDDLKAEHAAWHRATYVCPSCLNTGHVCEEHPGRPWEGLVAPPRACDCGGAGVPCPACCDPDPGDGSGNIGEAFVPPHLGRRRGDC